MGPRSHGTDEKVQAEEWIQKLLREAGAAVTVHEFRHTAKSSTAPTSFRNIVGRFRPAESKRILLGTHYDTRSWADRDPKESERIYPIPGANDGGSGVVVLLGLADVWKAKPPPCGIDLVFFDGEDFGRDSIWEDYFLGSKAWVRDYPDYRPEWGIILDMVGDRDLTIRKERHSLEKAPAVVNRVWAAALRAGSKAFLDEPQSTVIDDHTAFLDKGIPVILLLDFDYPWFHTSDDTPNKCSPESLGQVGRAVLEAVERE